MSPRRSTKKAAAKRGRTGRRLADADAVLLRCATIERRLEGVDAALNILAQQISAIQAQIDHLAAKIRS
jgi:hypothetical protein